MALQPIISSMLIDFDENVSNMTVQQKAYQKQVYSAIKLNIAELQNYEIVDKFTQCLKCKMVLTDHDKGHVFDFEQIESNPTNFMKQTVEELRKNKFSKVLWICGFCNFNNIISTVDLRFTKNKARVIERQKTYAKQDPILLIVFDVSGSMQQVIDDGTNSYNSQYSSNSNQGKANNWTYIDKIKQTKIYKKIVEQEKKQLNQIMKSINLNGSSNDTKNKYVDYLKKNKLLMGVTEHLINKINLGSKKNPLSQQKKPNNDFVKSSNYKFKQNNNIKSKTIGFVFFNSGVMLSLGNKEKAQKILLVDSNDQYSPTIQDFKKETVDFDSFDALYKMGEKYGAEYNTKIQNFDFGSLNIKEMANYSQGQTALGPAIVTALGIVSRHGQGSSIMVVTDGMSNKGIFDQTEPWQQGYKLLKMRLQRLKCFMTVLQFRKLGQSSSLQQDKNSKQKYFFQYSEGLTSLDRFCIKYNDSVVRKINIFLNQKDKNPRQYGSNNLDDIEKKLKSGIDRNNSIFSNDVIIKCQHSCVNYGKTDEILKGKLFNCKQVVHISPEFKQSDLKQRDYLHQFMTQIVIKYQNTATGEQSVFMSYIIQKFIKYSKIRQKDLKSLDNQDTFMNVLEYLNAQEEKLNLDNIPLGLIKQTFRKTLCRLPIAQKTLRFPDMKQLKEYQGATEWMENMRKFQDPNSVKKQQYDKIKQQQKNLQQIDNKESNLGSNQKMFNKITSNSTKITLQQQQDEDDDYVYL